MRHGWSRTASLAALPCASAASRGRVQRSQGFHVLDMHGAPDGTTCVGWHAQTHATGLTLSSGSHVMQRRAALASTQVLEPRIPVISNVDAQPHSDPDTIKDILARQVQCFAACVLGPCLFLLYPFCTLAHAAAAAVR